MKARLIVLVAGLLLVCILLLPRGEIRENSPHLEQGEAAESAAGANDRHEERNRRHTVRFPASTSAEYQEILSILSVTSRDSATVVCNLEGQLPDAPLHQGLVIAGKFGSAAAISGGFLLTHVPLGDGEAVFNFTDIGRGTFRYSATKAGEMGECLDVTIIHGATGIYGTVIGPPIEDALVIGCGTRADVEDGAFFLMVTERECELQLAVSVDDTRAPLAVGTPLKIVTAGGQDLEVTLYFPTLLLE